MNAVVKRVSERIAALPVYQPGKPPVGLPIGKLSSNESSLGSGPAISRAIVAAVEQLHLYPYEESTTTTLAASLGVPNDHVLLSNGSDELCFLIATVFLGAGRMAVVGDPCYAIDATATLISGAQLIRVPLVDGAHDLDELANAAQSADVVWLPTPHNPTGVAVTQGQLFEFVSKIPETCLVVLDQAYGGYVDDEFVIDPAELVTAFPHVLVQRTLSKNWAVAGLRVGYAIARPEVIGALRTVRPPFSVNSLALAAVEASVNEPAWQQMTSARVREGRANLEAELATLGVEYFPSQANFVLAKIDATKLAGPLADVGISVRDGATLGIPGWTRITIGWAPTMATLVEVLRDVVPTLN